MTTNALTFMSNEENKRHNLAMEAYYQEQNAINARNATSNERNAASNAVQAQAAHWNAQSNAKNAETNATNAVSNRMQAEASQSQAGAAWKQAYNTAFYNTGWLEELNRHNVETERLQLDKNVQSGISTIFGGISNILDWSAGGVADGWNLDTPAWSTLNGLR